MTAAVGVRRRRRFARESTASRRAAQLQAHPTAKNAARAPQGSAVPAAPQPAAAPASMTVTTAQRLTAVAVAAAFLVGLAVAPAVALTTFVALTTLLYLAALAYRMRLIWGSFEAPEMVRISDAEARAIPDEDLPTYTLLVPAYREPEVIARLLAEIDALEYPREKLEVKLLLEEEDVATRDAAISAASGPHVEIVRIPDVPPRTKPKACNVGLAVSTGQYVTIYDAEDRPEPLQLRRAVAAFERVAPDVVCLQARLSYYNAEQNLITRWFAAEYAMWFSQLLPGLVARRAPVPLGGTSNHFRREALVELGGWDAFNVTEDADLGIRLHRAGGRTAVLDSETLEEANSDFINWVKQRSRWYKGYLQTWLVHMREPRRLLRELGFRGFIGFQLFVGGTPLLALLNPVFWAMTLVWFVAKPELVAAMFPGGLFYLALFSLVVGNSLVYYSTLASAHRTGRPTLVLAALLSPLYWAMMSTAAIKAALQLVSAPSFWEKTVHGLDLFAEARRGPNDLADLRS